MIIKDYHQIVWSYIHQIFLHCFSYLKVADTQTHIHEIDTLFILMDRIPSQCAFIEISIRRILKNQQIVKKQTNKQLPSEWGAQYRHQLLSLLALNCDHSSWAFQSLSSKFILNIHRILSKVEYFSIIIFFRIFLKILAATDNNFFVKRDWNSQVFFLN